MKTDRKTLRTERNSFGKVSKVSSIYLAFIIHISRTIICNQMSKNLVNFTIFFFKMTKTKCKHQLLDSTADYWVALTNESSFSIYKFSVMRNQNKNFCRLSALCSSQKCDVRVVSEVILRFDEKIQRISKKVWISILCCSEIEYMNFFITC